MLQSLDVISVNIWQILISLANLLILFLMIKKFLYNPVKNVMAKRQSEIDERYSAADVAQQEAENNKMLWEEKLSGAKAEADSIISNATDSAKYREEKILAEANQKADGIVRRAKTEAELEMKKAADGIKREIVEVSGALTEKMIGREINTDDHRSLIDSFIEKIGDEDDGNQ